MCVLYLSGSSNFAVRSFFLDFFHSFHFISFFLLSLSKCVSSVSLCIFKFSPCVYLSFFLNLNHFISLSFTPFHFLLYLFLCLSLIPSLSLSLSLSLVEKQAALNFEDLPVNFKGRRRLISTYFSLHVAARRSSLSWCAWTRSKLSRWEERKTKIEPSFCHSCIIRVASLGCNYHWPIKFEKNLFNFFFRQTTCITPNGRDAHFISAFLAQLIFGVSVSLVRANGKTSFLPFGLVQNNPRTFERKCHLFALLDIRYKNAPSYERRTSLTPCILARWSAC